MPVPANTGSGISLYDSFFLLLSKIPPDLFHPLQLLHLERASLIAVSTLYAVVCCFSECKIMLFCQRIPKLCQIIILVDQGNIKACRSGMTMSAVHTFSYGIIRCKGTDHGIIPLFFRAVQIGKDLLKLTDISRASNNSHDTWLIQCILDTL